MNRKKYFKALKIPYKKKLTKTSIPTSIGYQQMNAFNTAGDIRKFEIELFWKRGTYFWAFILASYTAYFYIRYSSCNTSDTCNAICKNKLTENILLCATSFLGYLFSVAWVYINKGSKFWQKNWEAHIDYLENEITGKLYKTFLDTNTDDFSKCPFSVKPYDYSVTKITSFCSNIFSIIAAALFTYQCATILNSDFSKWSKSNTIGIVVGLVIIGFICCIIMNVFIGNQKEQKKYSYGRGVKFVQRKI